MLGHYRQAGETPFKWRLTGGLIDDGLPLVVFGSSVVRVAEMDPAHSPYTHNSHLIGS